MNVLLDDLSFNRRLYPFASLRPMVHIRMGIFIILEKWQFALTGKIFLTSERQSKDPGSSQIMPANIIPSANFLKQLSKDPTLVPSTEDCKILEHPWQIFEFNDWAIRQDFEMLTAGGISEEISSTNKIIRRENIFVEAGASINYSVLNAAHGPIYIGKNAEVQEGSLIRGPFVLCEGSRVKMGAKIYGATTIGPFCLAGGEIKNSILFGYSNKAHDGYLGDSVIGEWCNLGAGTSNSNMKNNVSEVRMWNEGQQAMISTGVTKCGLILGDYSRSAINTSFNTGTMVGICSNVFGEGLTPTFIPNFTWGAKGLSK